MKKFEDILAQCIEDIKAGRSNIEDCLDRYSSVRERLEPLLRIALEIREPPDVKPSPSFKVKARVWLMDQIHERQTVTKLPWFRYNSQMKPISYISRFSMASVILVIVVALIALGGGTVYAAQDSLPGDALYPVKLGTEQVIMLLPGNDVVKAERAVGFAERRIGELEALAEKGHPQDLDLAVEGYDNVVNMTLAKLDRAGNRGLATENITARVAEATSRHLSVLDKVYDMVPNQAKAAIAHAMNVSQTGYFHALAALANNNTVRATEMNLAAMEGRLNRVRARVQDGETVQIALQQFEAMAAFGEEISRIAQETGLNITEVEELIAQASGKHLEVLAEVWERVPEQAKPAIEKAMANLMIRHQERVQALEQRSDKVPPSPTIPEKVRERIEERIQEQEQGGKDGTMPPGQSVPAGGGHQNGHGAS